MDQLLEQWELRQPMPPLPPEEPAPKLDLFDVLLIFVRRKWLILGWTLAGVLVGFLLMELQPKLYESNTVILPPHSQQAASGLSGSLSLLAGFGGGMGMSTPDDLYLGLLRSRNVAEHMVQRFHLMDVYHVPRLENAAVILEGRSKFFADKNTLITITVDDRQAQRAADLANGYAEELFRLNNTLAIGEASQRRIFFEQQLALEKDKLADAEIALKNTQLKTGVLQVSGQTQAIVQAMASLEANIRSDEVQLAALSSSATGENPEVVRLRAELTGLRAQLANMQKAQDKSGAPFSAAQMPAAGLEYIRKERDVQYHQTLYDLLARQLEAARIDEAKASPMIQILDRAEVPQKPSWPSRKIYLGLGLLLGFVLGCVRCAVVYLYDFADADPRFHDKFVALKRAARLRV